MFFLAAEEVEEKVELVEAVLDMTKTLVVLETILDHEDAFVSDDRSAR